MKFYLVKKNWELYVTILKNEGILDAKYFIWFFLMLLKAVQVTTFPQLHSFDYVLALFWMAVAFMNIARPREMIMWFMAGYFTNIMHWFTDMALSSKGGSRILMLDIFLLVFAGILVFYILKIRKVNRVFLGSALLILTVYWMLNMFKGISNGGGGYVIGEARFYFSSVLLIGIVNLFDKYPQESFRKVLKIISLCSINIIFFIVMQVLMGSVEGGAEMAKRYNPGNGLAQVLVLGFLISVLDFAYGFNEHIIKGRKVMKIAIYLAFIFISGVRGVLITVLLILGYFLVISNKLTLTHKLIVVTGLLAIGVISVQFSPVQRVLKTQQEYVYTMMGEGEKNAKTTSDFRMEMWGVFWDKLTEDNTRMLFGRPFGLELIDISSFYWAKRENNTFVDNSLAHNDFLAISMTNGLVFTGILLIVLIAYVVRAFVQSWKVRDISVSYLLLFFGWSLFGQIFQSATNAEIKHFGWSICLWIYLGILGTIFNYLKTPKEEWENQK